MVQFRVTAGKQCGEIFTARRLPFSIGRGGDSDWRLEDLGVWDRHLSVERAGDHGVLIRACSDALVAVNSMPVREAVLRQGDRISLGSAELIFLLAPTHQRGLAWRQTLIWLVWVGMTLVQVGLIYRFAD